MPKDPTRPRRVAELIKRELAVLIPRHLDDPRANTITITHTEMSPKLSSARVYFTLLAGSAAAPEVTRALNRACARLRRLLAERVILRIVPELRFYFDESIERGARVSGLIERAVDEDRKSHEPH